MATEQAALSSAKGKDTAGPEAQADMPVIDQDIVADAFEGRDSTYQSELDSYTTSIASSITNYKFQAGRRYHAYKEGSYVFPNDDKEADRLDIMHNVIKSALGGLFWAPVKAPKRILDIGTGTGIWVMEIGDQFPEADVLGNDLSPIQPKWVPPNVHFEVDDIEAPWTYATVFDYIHCRTMMGAISDWPGLVKNCYDFTAPGGYCEFTDFDCWLTSPDNTLEDGSALHFQNREVIRILSEMGKEPSPGKYLEKWVKEAGFEDVHVRTMPIPIGAWPKDKKLKETGSWMYLQLYEGVESFTSYLFTTVLGFTPEQVSALAAKMRVQMKDNKVHTLMHLISVYGRKPADKVSG